MDGAALQKVGPDEFSTCGIGCLADSDHIGHRGKVAWLQARFDEGLRFLLFRGEDGKPLAFLEYVPGESAWRPVRADRWLFVHCLWVYARGKKVGGLGSRLIEAVIDEARKAKTRGVAAMVSDGPWMVGRDIFLKNGFDEVAEADRFQMVAHRLEEGAPPRFRDISENLARYDDGLHLVFSAQCPMLPKSVHDVSEMAAEHGLDLHVHELSTPREAQTESPSYYGVFSLVWNGRLLSDHYVSKGRFRNILRKEIGADV